MWTQKAIFLETVFCMIQLQTMHLPIFFSTLLNAESSSSEDLRLFLEGSSRKHEQAQFSAIMICCFSSIYASNRHKLTWNIWQVNVRSFGHRNPLEEYKIDGCRFFISMLSATRRLTVETLLQYWSSPMESQEIFAS